MLACDKCIIMNFLKTNKHINPPRTHVGSKWESQFYP